MNRLIVAAAVSVALAACGSEGIDRANLTENGVALNDGAAPESTDINTTSNSVTEGEQDPEFTTIESDPAAPDNSVNFTGASGSADEGEASPTDTQDNSINLTGASGSADEGEASPANNTSDSSVVADDPPTQTPQVDASLSTSAPSGTTNVSTMSPIGSEAGPLCVQPQKDANNNWLTNERGNCPLVQFQPNLKFGDFILASNPWNFCASSFKDWKQCISVDGSSGAVKPRWDYDWGQENQVNGDVWLVKSYPEVIYGIKSPSEFSGSTLTETPNETGLPAKVSELPFYEISYAFSSQEFDTHSKPVNPGTVNERRVNGERNVAVEAFFHELGGDCDPNSLIRNGQSSNQRFEIMVWLDAGPERLPAAPRDYITTQTLDGIAYDIYTKSSDREYIAFVSTTPTTRGQLNWNTFVKWTSDNAHRVNELFGTESNPASDTVKLQDDWCMANILLGTEIWWGAGYFQLDDWTINRTVQ